MAVTSKEIRSPHSTSRTGSVIGSRTTMTGSRVIVVPAPGLSTFAYLITGLLAMLAIYVLVGNVIERGQLWLDDMRYGMPRTMHLEGYVGQGEANGQPSHFIAMNLDRQVVVLQLPGGDASQVRNIIGPYLFGASEDRTPVVISLHDIDSDGNNDLLMDVRKERVVYLNREGGFRLPTPEEQQMLHERLP